MKKKLGMGINSIYIQESRSIHVLFYQNEVVYTIGKFGLNYNLSHVQNDSYKFFDLTNYGYVNVT